MAIIHSISNEDSKYIKTCGDLASVFTNQIIDESKQISEESSIPSHISKIKNKE